MFEETLYQNSADGKPFVDILTEQGIKPGIKVDTGLQNLPGTDGETATQGLDGLGDRMKAYREQVCYDDYFCVPFSFEHSEPFQAFSEYLYRLFA